MTKTHALCYTIANYETIHFFYKAEKNDANGNPRYRVFIIDPDLLVYETIFHCYECRIEDHVISFCEGEN